ncbi:MAG: hypothetical protein ACTHW3_05455 [Leucobacter sp.]
MTGSSKRTRAVRVILFSLLGIAVLVLVWVVAATLPMFTHQSAGGSGQMVPDAFVSQVEAEGSDGRLRELQAETVTGDAVDLSALQPGDELVVEGAGFDAGIGIYVAICAIPDEAGERPTPCLGEIPEGAESGEAQGETGLSSVWITNDWAWRAFATQRYDSADDGTFSALMTVPQPTVEGLNCLEQRCAVTTRADHTASADRVQDMQLPVAFVQ